MTDPTCATSPLRRLRLPLIASAAAMLALASAAQAAVTGSDLDAAFNPNVNNSVRSVALATDGTMLIGGTFSSVGGQTRARAARLLPDGTLDTSFADPNVTGGFAEVYSVVTLPGGGSVIAGNFTTVGGQTRNNLARLNPNGTTDLGVANLVFSSTVWAQSAQADGGIFVAGGFATVAGQAQKNATRLRADGTRDTGFADVNANNTVFAVAAQPDGKAILGGGFGTVGTGASTVTRTSVARLNANGTPDTAFADPNLDSGARALALQPDGKIIVGGEFDLAGSPQVTRNRVARLNADGTLDTSFGNPVVNNDVLAVALQADGKIVIGGNFTSVGGQARGRIARLNADGTLDATFGDASASATVRSLTVQPDGRIVVAGDFTSLGGDTRNRIARLLGTGPQIAPTGVTATAGNGQATVSWSAVAVATSYTVTSSPGGRTCTASAPSTSCTVTGLTNGTSYTFTVAAANQLGAGPASTPSNAVTPTGPGGSAVVGTARLTATLLPQRRRLVGGQQMRLGIRTANAGTATATAASACMTLPENLVVVKAGTAARSGRTLCFRLGDVAAGSTVSRSVTVRAVAVRKVTRTIAGTARAAGLTGVSAPLAAVTIVPPAVRAPVTG